MSTIKRGAAALAVICATAACAPGGMATGPAEGGRIGVGQRLQGSLSGSNPSALERGPFRAYRFDAAKGQRLVATMESGDFDTYLTVARMIGPVMETVKSDDDGGGDTNSRVRFTAPESGSYLLIAQSLPEDGAGSYTLALNPAPASNATVLPLTLGQRATGQISETDEIDDESERPYDTYTFRGRAGQRVTVKMEAEDFDTYLDLGRMENGAFTSLATDDDGAGEGTNSRLRFVIPADGDYVIRASAYGEDGTGDYIVSMEERQAVVHTPQPVRAGVTATGTLEDDDMALESDGSFYDAWTYAGRAGEQIKITMASEAFDTFVTIGRMVNGEFEEVAKMDDGGEGTDTLLEVTLPADGEYVIRANSYQSGQTGDYTLRVESSRNR
ncbi:PPC domain-containing protein [Longimicrobium terrae]|uniref:Peptidase C-terminal archaeal/bacterial domain-containing protein n=1 Tax=Longimicrobium terrae TaxID=1639882 RepID=A0A841GY55_9BACT|nr:PPC domain-containing protein [Longimicrobium terrae]MBB4636294.1 hypothetical protein [Longimicrobium terrae]MBB6070690.1 hypothetical protein [Longimicrobium terrae]NNC29672.1 hypothetical protein [Longimicrobium terrae]